MNEKQIIFDELSKVLTDYENNEVYEDELYKMLVKIQSKWEDTITAQE